LYADLLLQHFYVFLDRLLVIFHALLQRVDHFLVFLRHCFQNVLLLLLHPLDGQDDVSRHVVDLFLLFQSLYNLWQLLRYLLDAFRVFIYLVDYLLFVPDFLFFLNERVIFSVFLAFLQELLDFILQQLCPFLEEHNFGFVQKFELPLDILNLLSHGSVPAVCVFPVAYQVPH
jgi:hypothetical protein